MSKGRNTSAKADGQRYIHLSLLGGCSAETDAGAIQCSRISEVVQLEWLGCVWRVWSHLTTIQQQIKQ